MWGLAYKFGFTGGRMLEPSVGIGDFLKVAPMNVEVVAYEINPYSATICQLLYPQAEVHNSSFETIFFNGFKHLKGNHNIGLFDLVIGNPPYGEFTGKYAGMGEKKFTKAKEYDHYFITRGIDLLRPGGLLVFIIPSSFLDSAKSHSEVKKRIASKAELKDAYRLPNGIFKSTDVGTDIVVFKKR
jgi:type I restriction-modification system DNA methylase subunit